MRYLHDRATARHLGLLRIWVFGFWMADIVRDPITQLASVPLESFRPFGVLHLLPGFAGAFHTPLALRAFWAMLVVFLCLSALGTRRHHLVAGVTCVLLTLYVGLIFGYADMWHGQVTALLVTYVIAIFPSADGFSVRTDRHPSSSRPIDRAGMLAATIVFLMTYALVGVRRVVNGGWEIFTDGTILSTIAERSAQPDHLESSIGLQIVASPWLSTTLVIGFVAVTACEILSLLCLTSKWFRRLWLLIIGSFHVLTWPLMQILFAQNMLLICVLLLDLEWVEQRLQRVTAARMGRAGLPSSSPPAQPRRRRPGRRRTAAGPPL